MPRNRRDDNELTRQNCADMEEDHLDVDKPLPGQNYYCISFVSPEKVLKQKELFMYYHYEKAFYKKIREMMDNTLSTIIDGCEDGKVDITDIVKLKKNVLNVCKDEDVTFSEFHSKFEDFIFRDEEKIGEVFDKENNFQTSVRGIKVRGVFDTKREADIRSAVLQRLDSRFDVFVGQVGYWCPWDPNPHKIDDIEYLNQDLNKLVKEYKANEIKKDQFYQEQKTQRQKDSLSVEERAKHQKGLSEMRQQQEELKAQQQLDNSNQEISQMIIESKPSDIHTATNSLIGNNLNLQDIDAFTQNLDIYTSESKENNLEAETTQMQADDPWLQRKIEQINNTSSLAK
jgi:hypothetical protein